jgi:arylsulfatase A-like enzyme
MHELERLGLDQNTVILLMSDNGYFLGERGYAGKWTMHDTSIRVPFILYDPRPLAWRQRSISRELVLNIDLAPTLLDLAGVPAPTTLQGLSLKPLCMGHTQGWRSEVFCEHLWDYFEIPQTEAVRTKRWKYIRYPGHPGFEELLDLARDPHEEVNLADRIEHQARVRDFRKRCDHHVERFSKQKEP